MSYNRILIHNVNLQTLQNRQRELVQEQHARWLREQSAEQAAAPPPPVSEPINPPLSPPPVLVVSETSSEVQIDDSQVESSP